MPLVILAALVGLSTGIPAPASAGSPSSPPALILPTASTSSISQAVTFDSDTIDVWGDAAAGESWQLINAEWSDGVFITETTDVVGFVDFSFDSSGCNADLFFCINNAGDFVTLSSSTAKIGFDSDSSVAGHIKLSAQTTNIQGTAEITYPGTASVEYPSPDSFLAGQTVDLGGNWALGVGATINASESKGDLRLYSDIRVAGKLDVTGYSASGSSETTVVDFDGRDQITLFSLSAFDPIPPVPPLPLLKIGGSVGSFRVDPDDISVDDGVVTATGTDTFPNIVFDLDGIATSPLYGIGAPTLGENVDLQSLGVPLVLGYDFFDAKAFVDFTASQTLTFNPITGIKLSFDPPPAGINGPYESKALDNSWVIFDPGEQVSIEFPPGRRDPIDVTPPALLGGTLRNESSLGTESLIQLLAGRFDYQIPSFEIFPKFGPIDTGVDYPHPHADIKWDENHPETQHHDNFCFPCVLHVHTSTDHHSSICVCFGHFHGDTFKWHHTHSSSKYHHVHLNTHHHDTFSFGRILHLHNVSIHPHDINIGPWGPWDFPGLDITQDPVGVRRTTPRAPDPLPT